MSAFLAQNQDFNPFIDFVLNHIEEPPRFILDFACQKTPLLEALQAEGYGVMGIETANAEMMAPEDFKFDMVVEEVEKQGKLDYIYSILGLSSFALGSTGFDRETLEKLSGMLANDGKILLVLPYGHADEHIKAFHRFYDSESLQGLLESFDTVNVEYLLHNLDQRIWVNVNEEVAGKSMSNMMDGVTAVVLVVANKK